MKQKMLYITDELYIRLKNEDNASALIVKLLNSYYQTNLTNLKELKDLKISKENELEIIREVKVKEIETIEKQVDKIEQTEEEKRFEEEKRKLKHQEKKSNVIKNCKEVFNIKLTDSQAEEYLYNNYKSIKNFLIEKSLWIEEII
jgi:hypothetical protein